MAQQLTEQPGPFSDEVVHALTAELNLSVNTAATLANHLDEVILNALTHAESPIGAIVVGQAFPRNRAIEIAVLDLGQTIRGHLSKHPRHRGLGDDARAIIEATREGVTGTVGLNRLGMPNSGVGLYELRRYCEAGHGELAILSGQNFVSFGQQFEPRVAHFRGGFHGCLVNIRFFER